MKNFKIDNLSFVLLKEEYYKDFLNICNSDKFGSILLPNNYNSNLWGTIALSNNQVVGGWVGTLRGNRPIISLLSKGVWFDSYPIFYDNVDLSIVKELINYTKIEAKKDGIVLFNLTHWVRSNNGVYKNELFDKNATFLINLNQSIDDIWKNVLSKQRNIIRKGEKSNVVVEYYNGEDAITYLSDFQNLRYSTQKRAIDKNTKTSMLLKSNFFFENILRKTKATLFIAKYENQVVSVALFIQSGKTVYYYSGGSDIDANKKTGASTFLIWKAIEFFHKNEGVKYFDMGGVPVNPDKSHPAYGVFHFKQSFGGDYVESDGGKIIISSSKYYLLNKILKNRRLLRLVSRYEK